MQEPDLKYILEAAMLASGGPMSLDHMQTLFPQDKIPDKATLREALAELGMEYDGRGIEVKEIASGFRIQVREAYSPWVSRLWEEKPSRYSRALLETLAIIAYRQPITRSEIEDIRGVAVSTSIMRTLQERNWVRVVGHRDVPGRPAMFGTARQFLDYFNLKSLSELPSLTQLRDLDDIHPELDLKFPEEIPAKAASEEQGDEEREHEDQSQGDAVAENDGIPGDESEPEVDPRRG